MSASPQLRMDGGKYFSTVHGERAADDPHKHVHFFQDGLPFSATRVLLPDLIEGDERLMALAAKKLARQKKIIAPIAAVLDDGDNPQDVPDVDDDDETEGDVNLEMWLTGEAKYIFAHIRTTIAERYKKRVISIADAVMFLVGEQKIIPAEKLAAGFQGFMT